MKENIKFIIFIQLLTLFFSVPIYLIMYFTNEYFIPYLYLLHGVVFIVCLFVVFILEPIIEDILNN
jgi:hypothetical protein